MSNFTENQTAEIVAFYAAQKTEEARTQALTTLGARFNKSVAAIRGKLVAEKVYVAKATKRATKEVQTKDSLVKAIGILAGTSKSIDSLANASKADLQVLADALIAQSEQINKRVAQPTT